MFYFTFICIAVALCGRGALGNGGSVELDEFSFNKLISKFPAALVKFDVAFPYGEKHDTFTALARDASGVDELLVAEVGVKDYGEKDNEALAKKYGATKENFPVVKLFLRGKSEPVSFDSKDLTADELRRFVRAESGIYLSLPGCVSSLDQLVIKFMSEKGEGRKALIEQLKEKVKDLKDKDAASGKVYKLIMERVLEKGDGFVETEHERVKKLLAGKLSDDKKKELSVRLNILQTFQLKNTRDEL